MDVIQVYTLAHDPKILGVGALDKVRSAGGEVGTAPFVGTREDGTGLVVGHASTTIVLSHPSQFLRPLGRFPEGKGHGNVTQGDQARNKAELANKSGSD